MRITQAKTHQPQQLNQSQTPHCIPETLDMNRQHVDWDISTQESREQRIVDFLNVDETLIVLTENDLKSMDLEEDELNIYKFI